MENRMVTRVMTSRDLKGKGRDPQFAYSPISRKRLEIEARF